jgi:hypothetical protein
MDFLACAICFLYLTRISDSQPSGTPLVRQLWIRFGFTSSLSASFVTLPAAWIAISKEFMAALYHICESIHHKKFLLQKQNP